MSLAALVGQATRPLGADHPVTVGVLVLALVFGCAGVLWLRDRGKNRASREMERAMHEQNQREQAAQVERDAKAFAQHMRLQELTAQKLELEGRLLAAQAEHADRDRARNAEYHELMVRKTELEIQSLKLHIKEQMKRGEDFNSYDEP